VSSDCHTPTSQNTRGYAAIRNTAEVCQLYNSPEGNNATSIHASIPTLAKAASGGTLFQDVPKLFKAVARQGREDRNNGRGTHGLLLELGIILNCLVN